MKKIILITLLAFCAQAHAIIVGQIDFAGDFTLNHNYNFNDPAATPFGTFGTQTVQNVSGIFALTVDTGDTLAMNTPFLFGQSAQLEWTPSSPMIWNIGGFVFDTQYLLIAGPDSARGCQGLIDVGVLELFGIFSYWDFTAPPYDIGNFPEDITGPINLQITLDDGRTRPVPDTGSTLAMLGMALCAFGFFSNKRRKVQSL